MLILTSENGSDVRVGQEKKKRPALGARHCDDSIVYIEFSET